jgi:NAD(P)-dependent dehydrogenase (short-subunit alcohol dehydrogenase family)
MTTQYPASPLDGKVVIITGAASGMGRAAALLCAARGAAVVAADLNADGAYAVAAEIESSGGTALAQVADLTAEDDVNRLVEAAVGRFGAVHAHMPGAAGRPFSG